MDAHHVWASPARTAERRGREAQHLWWFSSKHRQCVWWSHTHLVCPVQHNNNLFTIFFFFTWHLLSDDWGLYVSLFSRSLWGDKQTWCSVARLGRGEVVLAGGWWLVGVTRECIVPAEEWTRLGWGQLAMWQRQPTDADGDPWKTSGVCVCVFVWGGGREVGMGW